MITAEKTSVTMFEYFMRRREATRASSLRQPLWRLYHHWCAEDARTRMMQAQVELQAAFVGIHLCAPPPVREAAQDVMDALPRFEERPDDYISVFADHTGARVGFLYAARHALAYNPKPWQFLRKLRERRYQKNVEQRLAGIIDGSVPTSDAARDELRRLHGERREAS